MRRSVAPLAVLLVFTMCVGAQQLRIVKQIDNAHRRTLAGHVHPKARLASDQGRVSPSLELSHVTLALAPSQAQQAELDQLLTDQQNPDSPNFHKWVSPEEYGQRFGVGDADLTALTGWLQQQGMSVTGVARARNWISFDGMASRIEGAFQTELRHYESDGELHFANATEPSVPAALGGVISGIRGLNDFRLKPSRRMAALPQYTSGSGRHYLAPNDLAAIYNIQPLYNAGFDGSGQKIVVAGQTAIDISQIQQFRTNFNLPANDPQIVLVPNTKDPGKVSAEVSEADLDLEWSGAVARNAAIIFVYSKDVMDAVQYSIDQNLAPIVSTSYGLCEVETQLSDATILRSWARQGNSQGITWFAASGDAGGPDCNDSSNTGLGVDAPASIPEVTGVGGTEFIEGSGQYWSTNDSNKASASGYIPEIAWNDTTSGGAPSASGGGASQFFAKPSWQSGAGVPSDNARHVPDVALSASANHDGYLVYTGGSLQVFGGTSVPTPAFAGIGALLNQYVVAQGLQSTPGLGNINPKLYALAQNSSGVFHDVTEGDNIVTVICKSRKATCNASPVGYAAGAGYDQVTGLGSVDVANLAAAWTGSAVTPARLPSNSITLVANSSSLASNDVLFLIAKVVADSGITPSGNVTFALSGSSLSSVALTGSGGTATATLTVNAGQLPQGTGIITAQYSGDTASTASLPVTVSASRSVGSTVPVISAIVNGATFKQTYAPGMILTVLGSQLARSTQSAASVPLPFSIDGVAVTVNGVAAPLYYASPTQLNIQVPYETAANGTAALSINNNGQVTSRSFSVSSAAPGIFTDQSGAAVPYPTATRGQAITIYATGTGAVSPEISTGAAPLQGTQVANLPKPTLPVSVTVAGVPASIQFTGIPSGLVGLIQINLTVPGGIGLGAQSLVVTVGGIASAPAKLTITN